jgi:hypothetical protein
MSLAQNILDLQTQRDGLMAALLADSADPQPDYSVGGQSVQRQAWREGLMRQVNEINKTLARLQPREFRGQIL